MCWRGGWLARAHADGPVLCVRVGGQSFLVLRLLDLGADLDAAIHDAVIACRDMCKVQDICVRVFTHAI